MAEDLTDYMKEVGIRVKYLHSDIDTLERAERTVSREHSSYLGNGNMGLIHNNEKIIPKEVHKSVGRRSRDLQRSCFRVRGDTLEIYPAEGGEFLIRVEFFGDEIDRICEVDPLLGNVHAELNHITIFPVGTPAFPYSHQDCPDRKYRIRWQ